MVKKAMPLRYMGSYRDIRNPERMVSLVGIVDNDGVRTTKKSAKPITEEQIVQQYNEIQAEQAMLLARHNNVVRAQAQCRSSILRRRGGDKEVDELFEKYMQLEGYRISLRKEVQCIRRRASYLMNVYHKRLVGSFVVAA